MTETRHFRITGLVQGVGYRMTMQRAATRLGLAGWVRNRLDGSVEAVASGAPEVLDELAAWARHGPRSAVVESVRIEAWPGEVPTGEFRQIATL